MIFNLQSNILTLVNVVVICLFVFFLLILSNLYHIDFSAGPIDTINIGLFYITREGSYWDNQAIEKVPSTCENIYFKEVSSKKFDRKYALYCFSIKVFTLISLVTIIIFTILDFLNLLSKKAELYVIAGLIFCLMATFGLVSGVVNMIKKSYKKNIDMSYNTKLFLDAYYGYSTIAILVFGCLYTLLFAFKLFRLFKYNNCKIVLRK